MHWHAFLNLGKKIFYGCQDNDSDALKNSDCTMKAWYP